MVGFARTAVLVVCLGVGFLPCLLEAAIIGKDKRHEWFEERSERMKELRRATAILIGRKTGGLEPTETGYRLAASVSTHRDADGLCSDERYVSQPAPGECTAFLVAPDKLVTAAHCLQKSCDSYHYVFDFLVSAPGKVNTSFNRDQVFACRSVLAQDKGEDWAILQLDRSATGRAPFRLPKEHEPAVGTPLAILGSPRGLPLKIAGGASVLKPEIADETLYFEAALDAFAGNSGSPVVNTKTFEVEGIYVVGFGEFGDEEKDPATGLPCRRLRRYIDPSEATPGWATRTSRFRPALRRVLGVTN